MDSGSVKFIHQSEVSKVIEQIMTDRPDSIIVAYQAPGGMVVSTWAGDPLRCVGLSSLFCSDMAPNILIEAGIPITDPNHPIVIPGTSEPDSD